MIYELYPLALDCGIKPDEFWGYSLGELRDLMESYARSKRRMARENISARYELADLIGLYIQLPYDEKKELKIPKVWDTYKELFAIEKAEYEERQKAEVLELARMSRKEYADRYNKMRRQSGML